MKLSGSSRIEPGCRWAGRLLGRCGSDAMAVVFQEVAEEEEAVELEGTAPLVVNVPGCGLDAVKYSCTKFHNNFMAVGMRFDCEVAVRAAWRVAVPVAVRQASPVPGWVPGVVPLLLCALCVIYIRARRLFAVQPVQAPAKKKASLRPRGEPRSFYKRKMQEIDEWRRLRQLVLAAPCPPPRSATPSSLCYSDSEDDDLEDVVVGTVFIEPRPHGEEDDEEVSSDSPTASPEPPRSPPEPPPPPPTSPETSPTPVLVPVIVVDDGMGGALQPIAEETQLVSPVLESLEHGVSLEDQAAGPSWRGQPVQKTVQTVSCTVEHERPYDISQ